ncbi:uncharacterized protein LOC124945983 isoform X1 [Impatiens glandulifera]|uniref:uncharacterized protein LOC124945983 isoform X1 n=1 Tax=Impatiens glandulifera TaxID=253017 RepID=UPI001FB15C5E|nr:uncharacterized protein LOC124945983 isoform X1 [Impatiens glandulifera]
MMPAADVWVTSAMSDDSAVVELLLRLKQSSEAFKIQLSLLPPTRWGNRKLRSTTARKEQTESTRRSPTTPLSWSGGGALASDSYDEYESSDVYSVSRSKGALHNDIASISSSSKRSRKNKTFGELQEEENLQLKESIHLNKELENLRINLEEQKARNESLKRIKNDILLQSADKTETRTVEAFAFERGIGGSRTPPCLVRNENKNTDRRNFILPDLNMEPAEEDED